MPYRPSPWWIVLSMTIVLMVGLQVIPYGRDHSNPPVVGEPRWDSPQTRALVKQACFDCHSNETRWPWYAKVAPASWMVQHDVTEARAAMNFSDWRREHNTLDIEEALKRKMPLNLYTTVNAHARLGPSDRIFLTRGLARTVALTERQVVR
jgi:hypothetical protein